MFMDWVEVKKFTSECNYVLAGVIALWILVSGSVSIIYGLLVPFVYIIGVSTFYYLHRNKTYLSNILNALIRQEKAPSVRPVKEGGCSLCNDININCNKETFKLCDLSPWDDLYLHPELDDSIERLFNRILNEFVSSWYTHVSSDSSFELELKHCLRHASSVVLKRGLKVDLTQIIFKKLVPAGVSHLDDYLTVREMSERQRIPFVRAAVRHFGTRVHPATYNRECEIEYLRHLTECLMPMLVTHPQLHCPSFYVLARELICGWVLLPLADALADPMILNSLLLHILTRQPLTQYRDTHEPKVQFLENFVCNSSKNTSALQPDLSNVLKDPKLLSAFQQFLKGQGAFNILQFCLDVEEFNRKMLTPDISAEDLELLYRDAMDLFSVYFNPDSPVHVSFPREIVVSMKQVLEEDVGKLRTSPPLFLACEHAYNILENKLCPLFHASEEFFKWLSGPRVLSTESLSGSRPNRKPVESVGPVARISNKLTKFKGVLRGPVEGQTFDSDQDFTDLEIAAEMQMNDSEDRDLSAWRVSIPSVETRYEGNNKPYFVFVIDVQRIDVSREDDDENNHWQVERRYNDFYTLEAKLTEFHGEFQDTQLPTRRMLFFSAPGPQFLESRKQVFEDYVQRLISKPSLRGSDLIYAFLRSPGEFSEMSASPDGLSKLIRKTVPITLRKEKGQHLEPFISTFFASTEGKKSSKIEYKDISQESPLARQFRNIFTPVFRDNFNLTSETTPYPVDSNHIPPAPPPNARALRLQGFTNCLVHIGVCVYKFSRTFLRLALATRAFFGHLLDACVSYFLDKAFCNILVAPRLAHLIDLLQDAIFSSKSTIINSMDVEERASRALDNFCNTYWSTKLAAPAFKSAFCAVQCPQLNKQLLYTLLDIVAEEIFPELRQASNFNGHSSAEAESKL